MGLDIRRNKDLDDVFGLTPVAPCGPVPAQRLEPPPANGKPDRTPAPEPHRIPHPPKVGILVSVTAPKPIDPAKMRQGAIKVLHSMAMLKPEVRQAILECALRMDRA